ncbi:MAG: imidazole glycerol phosphate synthase subunit HisH [Gemmatimonadetes bacterium]|nr:imidazole glycerol phosphate synthase subunit HisH [Gemmatimonadota bacterium]
MSSALTIINYGAGNLRNVQKAIEHLGGRAVISSSPDEISRAEALVLPGVGHFQDGMRGLTSRGLDGAIREAVLERRSALLGICMGMQLVAQDGEEGGPAPGLGLLPMSIRLLESDEPGFRLPHIGWNEVRHRPGTVLFEGLPSTPDVYFVHSYHAVCMDESVVAATCPFAGGFTAAVERAPIFAVQFHPEKSQRFGLKILDNFLRYCRTRA